MVIALRLNDEDQPLTSAPAPKPWWQNDRFDPMSFVSLKNDDDELEDDGFLDDEDDEDFDDFDDDDLDEDFDEDFDDDDLDDLDDLEDDDLT